MDPILIDQKGKKFYLKFTTDHSASSYGLGVLLLPDNCPIDGNILDGVTFAGLLKQGWKIKTDSPAKICGALGVPTDTPLE